MRIEICLDSSKVLPDWGGFGSDYNLVVTIGCSRDLPGFG